MLLGAAQLPQYLLLTLTPRYSPGFVAPPLGSIDYALAALFVLVICIEMQGDNEQQRYQHFKVEAKERLSKGGKLSVAEQGKLDRGFVTSGLWSLSRHPVRRSLCSNFVLSGNYLLSTYDRTLRASNRRGISSISSPSSLSSLLSPPLPSRSQLLPAFSPPFVRLVTSSTLVEDCKDGRGTTRSGRR